VAKKETHMSCFPLPPDGAPAYVAGLCLWSQSAAGKLDFLALNLAQAAPRRSQGVFSACLGSRQSPESASCHRQTVLPFGNSFPVGPHSRRGGPGGRVEAGKQWNLLRAPSKRGELFAFRLAFRLEMSAAEAAFGWAFLSANFDRAISLEIMSEWRPVGAHRAAS